MSIPSIVSLGRRLIATTFLDECVIADRSQVRDSSGGYKTIWTDRGEVQECRFVGLTEDVPDIEVGHAFGVATQQWLAPLGTAVKPGDRLTNKIDNSKWIITSVLTPTSTMAISVRCGIREAEKGEAG